MMRKFEIPTDHGWLGVGVGGPATLATCRANKPGVLSVLTLYLGFETEGGSGRLGADTLREDSCTPNSLRLRLQH